jgi:hypothetical protein
MTKEGIDLAATLDTLTPATDFETEIVSCLRDAINAQK